MENPIDDPPLFDFGSLAERLTGPEAELEQLRVELSAAEQVLEKELQEEEALTTQITLLLEKRQAIRETKRTHQQSVNEKSRTLRKRTEEIEAAVQAAKLEKEREATIALRSIAHSRWLKLVMEVPWAERFEGKRHYQAISIANMLLAWENGERAWVLAHDRGLGKTLQMITFDYIASREFERIHGRKPVRVWLTKRSLREETLKEFAKWTNGEGRATMLFGPKEQQKAMLTLAAQLDLMPIINYEAIAAHKELQDKKYDFVYIDEVHKLKGGSNPAGPTRVWRNAKKACDGAFSIMSTGTLVQNHPREIWSYLHICHPDVFPTARQFEMMFTGYYGINWTSIIDALKGNCERLSKADVDLGTDLIEHYYWVDHKGRQGEIYRQIKEEFFLWYDDGEPKPINAVIAQLTRLRQVNLVPSAIEGFSCHDSGKLDQAVEIIHELVMEGEQVLVGSAQFNGPIYELRDRLSAILGTDEVRILTGAETDRVGDLAEDFRQGKYKVLITNMSAGAEGLNLHKAPDEWPGGGSHVVILDRWYNPARNDQLIGRCDRPIIPEPVTVHWIYNRNSVDNWLIKMNEIKAMYADKVGEAEELRKEYCSRDWLRDNI